MVMSLSIKGVESADEETEVSKTRAQASRVVNYTPPDLLDIPAEVRERLASQGNITRWIRIATRNETDHRNINQRRSEGYEFLTLDQAPEFEGLVEVLDNPRWGKLITVGDLALAFIPKAKAEARQRYYEEMSSQAVKSAAREARKHSTREAPVFDDSTSEVTRGRDVDFG